MDEAQFEELYLTHFQDVARAVSALVGSREDAFDIAQEAFALTWRRWSDSKGLRDPYFYVLRVANNVATSRLRRILAYRRLLPRFVGRPEESLASDQADLRVDVAEAVRSLPPRQRSVMVLCDLLGFSPQDAARVLRMSPSTLRVHRGRAHKKLRLVLMEQPEPQGLTEPSPRPKGKEART